MPTNRRFLREIFASFLQWLMINSKLAIEFDEIATYFEDFMLSYFLKNETNCHYVIKKFNDVHKRCNYLHFDNNPEIIAYNLFHFLNRYWRFQVIYLRLIEEGLLPIRKLPSDILEVGIGPGQGLFTLSDIFFLLKDYGWADQHKVLTEFEFHCDYVEKSRGFRQWLHHFTEYFDTRKGRHSGVPYHHGSFGDYYSLNFQELKHRLEINLIHEYVEEGLSWEEASFIVDQEKRDWKDRYHYNMLIFSNFITQLADIPRIKESLKSGCDSLRNGGILVIVGATHDPYPEIYKSISSEIRKIRYMYEELNTIQNTDSYSVTSQAFFERRLKSFYRRVYHQFEEFNVENEIPRKYLNKYFYNSEFRQPDWKLLVFRKQFNKR